MSYDCDLNTAPVFPQCGLPDPRDLEVIVTLLEIAALELTEDPSSTFTEDELIRGAQALGGAEVPLDPADVKLVLPFVKFLVRQRGRLRLA